MKILLVDDSSDSRMLLEAFLRGVRPGPGEPGATGHSGARRSMLSFSV